MRVHRTCKCIALPNFMFVQNSLTSLSLSTVVAWHQAHSCCLCMSRNQSYAYDASWIDANMLPFIAACKQLIVVRAASKSKTACLGHHSIWQAVIELCTCLPKLDLRVQTTAEILSVSRSHCLMPCDPVACCCLPLLLTDILHHTSFHMDHS